MLTQEPLPLPNKIEFISGIVTGILAIAASISFSVGSPTSLTNFLPYMLTATLVAAGSYLHVIRRNTLGFVMVILFGGLFSVMGIVGTAIVAVYAGPSWRLLLIYLPGLTAFVTIVASIITQLRRKRRAE